jgi:hypothetical protein
MDERRVVKRRWHDLRPTTRLVVILAMVLAGAVGLEVFARVYWLSRGVPICHAERIWHTFYPEALASGVETATITRDDDTYDVLLLGGSVLYPAFGKVAEILQTLEQDVGKPVRLYNLSNIAMTSLDSRLQYERLEKQRFDLVIVYDNINDVYMNECPAAVYRDDYAHAPRYAQIYAIDQHPELPCVTFPYTMHYLVSRAVDRLQLSNRPRREWQAHGADIKSVPAFAANVQAIVDIARRRGDPLVLMTYAYHIDPNYTEEAFEAQELDYDAHVSTIALWGTPENVKRTLDVHNAVTRRIAAENPGVTLIDEQALMPTGARYFNDICHLTDAGCAVFVQHIRDGLASSLARNTSRCREPSGTKTAQVRFGPARLAGPTSK